MAVRSTPPGCLVGTVGLKVLRFKLNDTGPTRCAPPTPAQQELHSCLTESQKADDGGSGRGPWWVGLGGVVAWVSQLIDAGVVLMGCAHRISPGVLGSLCRAADVELYSLAV